MLEMYLWENYGPEIKPQMKYWADFWKEKIESFPDYSYGLCLNSPRMLFNEILSEIEFNNLKNEKVKKYFQSQVTDWLKRKNLLPNDTATSLHLLLEGLKTEKHSYLAELCRKSVLFFESGGFFREIHQKLIKLLLKDNISENDYADLESISELLIIEFMFKGFSLKTCANIPKKIFAHYNLGPESIVITEYPTLTLLDNFKINGQQSHNYKKYGEAVIAEITALSIDDRLNAIARIYFNNKHKIKIIFPLNGIHGDRTITLGPVEIYSPEIKKYLTKSGDRDEELFGQEAPYIFSNAIVEVETLDNEDAIEKSIVKVESALDILKFHQNSLCDIEVIKGNYIILDGEGRQISWTASAKRYAVPYWSWSDSLNTSDFSDSTSAKINILGSRLIDNLDPSPRESQLATILHWFRKACEEKKVEDQLLNFWVALEKIYPDTNDGFNKIDTILDLVPYAYTNLIHYQVGWKIFYYMRHLAGFSQGGRCPLALPFELLKKSGLEPRRTGTIHLQDFINALPELDNILERKIIKDKIKYAQDFFNNNQCTSKVFQSMVDEVRTDILLAYRFRNKIVHDAHYNDILLPYYVKKLRKYLSYLISSLLFEKDQRSTLEVSTRHKAEMKYLLEKLKSDPSFKLFWKDENIS